MSDDFYTYELAYPESMGGAVFYVGKGRGDRIDAHERNARKGVTSHVCCIIRKIWAAGEQVVKRKVGERLAETDAFEMECHLIQFYGRENLANKTDGGEGISGYHKPQEERVRGRIVINLSVSEANEFMQLFSEYLISQGIEPTDENIKSFASDLTYEGWHERLERELEFLTRFRQSAEIGSKMSKTP